MKKEKNSNTIWIIKVTILAFIISFVFSFVSEITLKDANIFVGTIILLLFIFIGILLDIVGVAVTVADEKPIHSMNARKIKGAKVAMLLKKNSAQVSSFCNDVVGDICGIISGSAGVAISLSLSKVTDINLLLISLIVTAFIAALTIGGKAFGKGIAIKNSNKILYSFSKILSYFYFSKAK